MSEIDVNTCMYKGREYQLLWSGETRYGRRAKLGYTDGTKEFWVSADAIKEMKPLPKGCIRVFPAGTDVRRVECIECGSYYWEDEKCTECGGC